MRKGLSTLLTVAIALIGSQAMGMAPTIGDIPSPVVGGYKATQATKYVYPDAFNLDLLVSDDQTTPTSLLKWSYDEVGTTYLINGMAPNATNADPVAVADTAAINKNIGKVGTTSEVNPDGNKATVTIRNNRLNPLGGTMSTSSQSGFVDIIPITFWCSDGNAASSSTVLFYTDNDAANRLSVVKRELTTVASESFVGKSWAVSETFFGTITTHTWPADGKGICFEVAKTGNNWGSVASPMPFFSLSQNTLYRIRAKMNCSQVAPGHTPFWDFIAENAYDAKTKKGLNLFAMDQIFLDNNAGGGSAAVISTANGTTIDMYFAPSAVSTPQFATLFSNSAYATGKDVRLRFRVLDVDSNTALLNDQKYGAICLSSIQVDAIPMAKVQPDATPLVSITSFKRNTDTSNKTLNNTEVSGYVGPSIVFSSGTLTVTPTGTGTTAELITITPANDTDGAGGAVPRFTSPYTNMADEWPIPWVSNKLYELDVQLSAPDANGAAHPFDAMWMNIDCPTNEVNCESVITSYKAIASPKVAAPQTYKMFYNTQNETMAPQAAFHFLRWRVRFGNNGNLNFPNASDTTNIGGVRLHSLKVWNVTVPQR